MKVTESVSERQSWSSAMRIEDIRTYGLNESVMASGLPFALPDSTGGQTEAHAFERASRLASTPIGTGHDNFLCGIIVQCTVTAPLYWWPQLQRYHHIDVVSSTSTMHTLSRCATSRLTPTRSISSSCSPTSATRCMKTRSSSSARSAGSAETPATPSTC